MGKRWCLVLVLWGDAYSVAHVNALAGAALTLSTGCAEVVLLTDRPRPGLDIRVRAVPIPEFFDRPEFRRGGYVIKLSLFSRSVLPPDMPCVYLDLDTAVTGDLGRIAALVQDRNDIFMLPPGNLIGFGRLRRARFRLTRGRRMAVGNSSILAFHSAAEPNLADTFQRLYETGSGPAQVMNNDDRFISWFWLEPDRRGSLPAGGDVPARGADAGPHPGLASQSRAMGARAPGLYRRSHVQWCRAQARTSCRATRRRAAV
ncbi:hypothetical protein EOM89_04665 [Candidatus Falkowbacteria bacterium]|nr:hypothetical protein [Candidatus Falkowbacteria bacterium]